MKKKLLPYFSSKKEVDRLTFKDMFRHVSKYSLISEDAISRWFLYRDNRNNTAHDYGQNFADETLALIDQFISDVTELMSSINE